MTHSPAKTRSVRAIPLVLFALLLPTFAFSQTAWPAKTLVRDEPGEVLTSSRFGTSTSLYRGRAMVGAPNVDGHGVVYLFEQQGSSWPQTQRLVAPDIAPGTFGSEIVQKNNIALISDRSRNLVYSFENVNGVGPYRATATLRGGVELFGSALALEGCVALISSGAHGAPTQHGWVHVYNRCPDGKWVWQGSFFSPDASPGDLFGASLALSGSNLLVGAPGTHNNAGAAYHYVYSDGAWHFKQKLTQANPSGGVPDARGLPFGDQFGWGVGFANGLAAVGAPFTFRGTDEGEVTLYKQVNGSWVSTGVLYAPYVPGAGATAEFGFKIRVMSDRVYINSEPTNHYYMGSTLTVFRRVGDTLEFEHQFGPGDLRDLIGSSFDIDGRGLIIGNPNALAGAPFQVTGDATVYQIPSP